MAETLLAILLVTSSAKGPNVVCRWPPHPESRPRLSRPRPPLDGLELDNPWRAAHYSDSPNGLPDETRMEGDIDDIDDYVWRKPTESRDRSISFSRSPASGRNSPRNEERNEFDPVANEYQSLFGYTAQFLAGMLCPQTHLCHQKFELVIDNLVFTGHPVCAESDGIWRFKPERHKSGSRGRESRHRESSLPEKDLRPTATSQSSWLHMFHLVFVFDLPDPSSSASGNVARYFDTIYEQIAFTVTAVLFQEQVLSNFVETECDTIGSLETEYMVKGERFSDFASHAQQTSSLATAMEILYDAIKTSTMAHITLNDLPLELQLPPYLDHLLHNEEEFELDFVDRLETQHDSQSWGRELGLGWRLPDLEPWKSLLLLDTDQEQEYVNLRGSHVHAEERNLAEGLIRFLQTASVTLSLADMASLLDWDLHSQVYPTVRWLVHHRRAKIVDTVHNGLKTIFSLAPRINKSLSTLAAEFKRDFPQSSIPPLPTLMATISDSNSKQTDNHFFATVVQSKDLIDSYHEVVLWMLKRDLLITLHLHIRVVTTAELKLRVRQVHERKLERRLSNHLRGRRRSSRRVDHGAGDAHEHSRASMPWLSMSPKTARRYSRRLGSVDSRHSRASDVSGSLLPDDVEDVFEESEEDSGEENVGWGSLEDTLEPSMISDPGTASPLERKWLAAMSEGKDEYIARRFALINQYFDGKRTDDEILYTAEISRKQLREVLHHYDEYLQTFLHPS